MVGRTVAVWAGATLLLASPGLAPPASAGSALYMGGTFNQLSVPEDSPDFIRSYVGDMSEVYLDPTGLCTGAETGCAPLAVYTPEEINFVTGFGHLSFDDSVAAGAANLDNCLRGLPCVFTPPPFTATLTAPLTDSDYTVLGFSQSATIATIEKRNLIADPPGVSVGFVLVANPNRPNGGILQRFAGAYLPVLGVTFDGATPTESDPSAPLTTVDVAGQYDLMADFPTNPLNLLADLNALLGYFFVHQQPFAPGTPKLQGQYQDSTYYLIPTPVLPLLIPIAQIPLIGPLLATVLDPPLRVLVEAGYDRTINPGDPSPANPFYFPDPITTAVNVLKAIPTGWDNGIAYVTGDPENRPLGTGPQPAYGVGGPPVDTGAVDPYGEPTPYTPDVAESVPAASAEPAPSASEPAAQTRETRDTGDSIIHRRGSRTPDSADRPRATSRHRR
jgi:hypothetical protein